MEFIPQTLIILSVAIGGEAAPAHRDAASADCSFLEGSLAGIQTTLKILILCDPGGQSLGIILKKQPWLFKNLWARVLFAALLRIIKIRKQPT